MLPDATLVLALDRDRRYKLAFKGPPGEDERTKVSPDEVANLAVSALRRDNCDELAEYAFVYEKKRRWCERKPITELAKQLADDWDAAPRRLGGASGQRFYGLPIKGGHYWTLVLTNMDHYYLYYDAFRAK
jgi:hypothetical protein